MEFSFTPPEPRFDPETGESWVSFAALTGFPERGERFKPGIVGQAAVLPLYDIHLGFEKPKDVLRGTLDAQN